MCHNHDSWCLACLMGVRSRCPGLHMHRALYEYITAAHKVGLSGGIGREGAEVSVDHGIIDRRRVFAEVCMSRWKVYLSTTGRRLLTVVPPSVSSHKEPL